MAGTSSWIALFGSRPTTLHEKTWAAMNGLIDLGMVASPRVVHDEISARQDGLLSWVDRRPGIFFEPNREMLNLVVQINGKFPLLNNNKSRFDADSHAVALAVLLRKRGLHGRAPLVVTEEANSPDRPQRSRM